MRSSFKYFLALIAASVTILATSVISYNIGQQSMQNYVDESYQNWHDSGAKAKELEYEQRGARIIDQHGADDTTIYIVEMVLFGESQL